MFSIFVIIIPNSENKLYMVSPLPCPFNHEILIPNMKAKTIAPVTSSSGSRGMENKGVYSAPESVSFSTKSELIKLGKIVLATK